MDAAGWNTRYAESPHVWSLTPNVFVVEHARELEPGRALDLAAGEGRNAVWLAERGWSVTAVDFSEVGLDKGRRRSGSSAVSWVQADVTEWIPPQAGFELVVICYLHLPERERRIVHRRAADAVAQGGVLLVIGHDMENLTAGNGGPQDAAVLFDADDVIADLDGSGLQIITAGQRRRRVEVSADATPDTTSDAAPDTAPGGAPDAASDSAPGSTADSASDTPSGTDPEAAASETASEPAEAIDVVVRAERPRSA